MVMADHPAAIGTGGGGVALGAVRLPHVHNCTDTPLEIWLSTSV